MPSFPFFKHMYAKHPKHTEPVNECSERERRRFLRHRPPSQRGAGSRFLPARLSRGRAACDRPPGHGGGAAAPRPGEGRRVQSLAQQTLRSCVLLQLKRDHSTQSQRLLGPSLGLCLKVGRRAGNLAGSAGMPEGGAAGQRSQHCPPQASALPRAGFLPG